MRAAASGTSLLWQPPFAAERREKFRCPISMTPLARSMRMYAATPTARPRRIDDGKKQRILLGRSFPASAESAHDRRTDRRAGTSSVRRGSPARRCIRTGRRRARPGSSGSTRQKRPVIEVRGGCCGAVQCGSAAADRLAEFVGRHGVRASSSQYAPVANAEPCARQGDRAARTV